MISHFQSELAQLPDNITTIIEPQFQLYCEQFDESTLNMLEDKALVSSSLKVWACSPFVAQQCLRHPNMLNDLLLSGDLLAAKTQAYYRNMLQATSITSEAELMIALRCLRRREMVRIAWRDIAGWAELQETLNNLSWLADVCINFALDFLYQEICQQLGTPELADGSPQQLIVLAMGKLGGFELNFSSDIDLIFVYVGDGELTDRKHTSYSEFFTRLARRLVKVLDENTADGFVFRVDIRLRPFGDSGPLVMNFDGMENYYLTQARAWERYAMIKARQVTGDLQSGAQLFDMLNRFVYRRYLDYGAFAELRSLKLKIDDKLKQKDIVDNIKLGAGGIREIEFIGQAFQLIRGGREPTLQQRPILAVLDTLATLQQMSAIEVQQLQQAYRFLRIVENRLQQYQDQQTHELPIASEQQLLLAYAMGYSDWSLFMHELTQIREQVQTIFAQVFDIFSNASEPTKGLVIWLNEVDQLVINTDLVVLGYQQADLVQQQLQGFKNTSAIVRLTKKGAQSLDQLMPQLLEQIGEVSNPEATLSRILVLLEKVASRSVYLTLLAENVGAQAQLIKLSSASDWVCQYLSQHPVLFDELLDTRALFEPLSQASLSTQLQALLPTFAHQNTEQMMIVLREFKQANILKIAATDIMAVIPIMVVSDYLSYIADVVLEQVVQWAWQLLIEKHGAPPGAGQQVQGFAVIGMGKLGGFELGYQSDLDLVFVYDCDNGNALTNGPKPIACSQFYGRLGQRVMTMINTRMLAGVLYEVDMRLRPSGNSGLLVSHLGAYRDYLHQQAWTWEHQALVRGRCITGDLAVKHKFEQMRAQILCLPRERGQLKTEINAMRTKMRTAKMSANPGKFHLKQDVGGIVDIEFIVQFCVLAHAEQHQQLIKFTETIRILAMLKSLDLLAEDDVEMLQQSYCDYRDRGHQQTLQGETVLVDADEFTESRKQITRIWAELLG